VEVGVEGVVDGVAEGDWVEGDWVVGAWLVGCDVAGSWASATTLNIRATARTIPESVNFFIVFPPRESIDFSDDARTLIAQDKCKRRAKPAAPISWPYIELQAGTAVHV
jgi:hypothetical protein